MHIMLMCKIITANSFGSKQVINKIHFQVEWVNKLLIGRKAILER